MKYIKLLLFLAAVSLIESPLPGFSEKKCSDYSGDEEIQQAYSKDFCRALKLDSPYDKCCYMKYKNSAGHYFYNCVELSPSEFNHIDDTIGDREKGGIDIKSLECDSSSYLYGSLLLLLAFLF